VVKGVSGQTALHCVLECDYKFDYNKFFCSQIAELLLEHMAVVDIQDILGYTPLMWAARWEYPVIVHKLLDRGADVSHADKYYKRNALHWGAFGTARTCNQVVASILAHGVQDIDVGDKHGQTALMLVAGNGRRAVVLQFLKEGANANAANRNGETALHYVAASKNRGLQFEYTLIMLLRHGADVNIRSRDCFAPLTLAIRSNRMFMAKILLDHGAVVWNRAGRGVYQTPS